MLSVKNLTSVAAALKYFKEADYYAQDKVPTAWWGRGAEALGLDGEVDLGRFAELLKGQITAEVQLAAGPGGKRRPGTDMTFSAPKSVSLLALVYEDQDIHRAHQEAVHEALSYLEERAACTRIKEGGHVRREMTGTWIVAQFEHATSRKLDPQLHTHCVIVNATQDRQGTWRAWDNEALYDHKMVGGLVYREALARRLRALGYALDFTGDKGLFEIKGFDAEQLKSFSQRRADIEAILQRLGRYDAKTASWVTESSRPDKVRTNEAALKQAWVQRCEQMGMAPPLPSKRCVEPLDEFSRRHAAQSALEWAIAHITERKSVFDRQEILQAAHVHTQMHVPMADLEKAFERACKAQDVIALQPDAKHSGRASLYTSAEVLEQEHQTVDFVRNSRGHTKAIVHAHVVSECVSFFAQKADMQLTDGQRAAAEMALATQDIVVGVQGYAGTGKTAMMRIVREAAEHHGYTVRGFSASASAALGLQKDAGIQSTTLARHLIQGQNRSKNAQGPKKQLWVVDEASMMSTRQAYELVRLAERDGARLLLIGDRFQLPSIERGRIFGLLMDRGMTFAEMTEIIRQKDSRLRKAVQETVAHAASQQHVNSARVDHAAAALKALDASLIEIHEPQQRRTAIARQYVAMSPEEQRSTLVLTPTNAARQELNALIREGLIARSQLGEIEISARTLRQVDYTEQQKRDVRSYQAGQTVCLLRAYRSLGIQAGTYGVVKGTAPHQGLVSLQLEDGREIQWSPSRQTRVAVYREEEIALRAGERIRWTQNAYELGRINGGYADVLKIDAQSKTATVRLDDGKIQLLSLNGAQASQRHWTHAYACTAHAAQGATARAAIVEVDTGLAHMAGYESFYVGESRAREKLTIYCDNSTGLRPMLDRYTQKKAAMDYGLAQADAPTKSHRQGVVKRKIMRV